MRALLLLAVLATAPAQPPERWIPYPQNPGWELYGREDASGVFRYSQTRHKAEDRPVRNLGVNLPTLTQPREVMATDAASAALVYRAVRAGGGECGHSDCDGGQCDRDRPRKKKPDAPPEIKWLNPSPEHIAAVALAAAVCLIFGLGAFIVVALLVKWIIHIFRKE